MAKEKRSIGPVTAAAAGGGTIGTALSQILAHAFPSLEPVEVPIAIILTAALAVYGGYLIPPGAGKRAKRATE